LRASEERFRILAVTANDAILSADARGHITYFNPGAERIFGLTADEVIDRPLTTLMPERFREAHRAGLARYVATGDGRGIGKTSERRSAASTASARRCSKIIMSASTTRAAISCSGCARRASGWRHSSTTC